MTNPIGKVFYWFFSQDFILYIHFVPLMAVAFFAGLIGFTRRL